MSEAKNTYLHSKGDGRPVTFAQAVDRAIMNLVNAVGDKPIDTYSRQDANLVRDCLFERGLTKASVKRVRSPIWTHRAGSEGCLSDAKVGLSGSGVGLSELRTKLLTTDASLQSTSRFIKC